MGHARSQKYEAGGAAISHPFTVTGVAAGESCTLAIRFQTTSAAALGTVTVADDQNAGNWSRVGPRFSPDADDTNQCEVFFRGNLAAGDTELTISLGASLVIQAIATFEDAPYTVEDYAINEVGNNPATHTSGTVTATGANRRLIGVLVADSSTGGASPNSGETERQEALAVLQVQDKDAATAGDYTTAWSFPSAPDVASFALLLAPDNLVALTDVDTDETITVSQTNVMVAGSGFGDVQGAGKVEIIQGATAVEQSIDTWSDTAIQFDVVQGALTTGAAVLRVTSDDEVFGEIAITLTSAVGVLARTLISVRSVASDRITAVGDLIVGDILEARAVGGGAAPAGLAINDDGSFEFAPGSTPTSFECRAYDSEVGAYGAWAVQTIA